MFRYQTIFSIGKKKFIDYEAPKYEKGKYIVDKSHFTPESELAKSVIGQSIGKTDLARYDFVDGTDNGMSVPVARRRPELAELSVDVKRQQKAIKDKLETALEVAKIKAETANLYKVGNDASSSE